MPYPASNIFSQKGSASGFHFTILDSIDSTNNYAMAQAHAGSANHGHVFFAKEQTAGKGQRGKIWLSNPGENVIMSMVLQPEASAGQQFLLSAGVALACIAMLRENTNRDFQIKWPNDIYFGDRKAGGILIENIFQGNQWLYAIAGVGINTNQENFPDHLPNPTSLKLITGETFSSEALAMSLAKHILGNFDRWKAEDAELLREYNEQLYKKDEDVWLKKDGSSWQTTIEYVSADGTLHVKDETERSFHFGEVEWVI